MRYVIRSWRLYGDVCFLGWSWDCAAVRVVIAFYGRRMTRRGCEVVEVERRDEGASERAGYGQALAMTGDLADLIRSWLTQNGVEMMGRSGERHKDSIGVLV
jgi:hypothetical protein